DARGPGDRPPDGAELVVEIRERDHATQLERRVDFGANGAEALRDPVRNRPAETHRYDGRMDRARCGRLVDRRLPRRAWRSGGTGKIVDDTDDLRSEGR